MRTLLYNAQIVLPDTLIGQGWLLIEGERILALGEGSVSLGDAERVIDARQALLLPGLIDLHCDSIEKVVEPRPHVFFDINFALQQVDWRLAGSGITTEFHAVSLDDGEFSVRSDRFVYDLYSGLQAETDLLIRHKLHELGLAVCMGAPNVVRGRSSGGNLSATAAIETGVANVLCSDYYPPAMLSAIFTLTKRGTLTLPEATRLVTLNPARAVGLAQDFGSLEVGKVADIILVTLDKQHVPVVLRVFVGGEERVVRC
jgi:alpha-D-ribose 1-methylphosphonate 5-triphosphate diphosphatase PhnM